MGRAQGCVPAEAAESGAPETQGANRTPAGVTDGIGGTDRASRPRPSAAQVAWLQRGLDQPGGKLPLFDAQGQRIHANTIRSCIDQGWAEPWFRNPTKPDWLVCRLTQAGRVVARET